MILPIKRIAGIAAAFLLTMPSLPAKNNTWRRHDVRSGLSDSSVKDICQDSRGYMYFATKDGLNRFNGYDFQVFGSSSTGQTHNVEAVCPHHDGIRIWMATTHGLCLFDPRTEQITPMDMTGKGQDANPNCMYLQYDCRGDLWIASMDGVFRYNCESGEFRHYAIPAADRTVRVVFEDVSYNIWAGTTEGLSRYSEQLDAFEAPSGMYPEGSAIGDNEITAVCLSSGSTVLLGTQNGDFAAFDTSTGEYRIYPPVSSSGEHYNISRIHSIYLYSNTDCYVGSDSGLFYLDCRTGLWSRSDDELSNESVYKFFRDREGSLWIGTYFLGVCYMSEKQNEIEWYYDNGQKGSLNGCAVSQFCEDADGNLWIATENGGLNFLDMGTGRLKDLSSKSHYNLHALCLDGNSLWIGTFSCGLDCMDLSTGMVRRYKNIPSDSLSICSDYVYSIYRHDDRYLYIGTLNGLCIFDKVTEKFRKVSEIGNRFINDIVSDSEGNIWLADKNAGIWKRSSANGTWKNYRHDDKDSFSPVGDRITRVYVDSRGSVWFCEEGNGICRYLPELDAFENFTSEDNLPSSIYYGILEDDTGYYWISSNSGLIRYNPALKTSIRYTAEDGLQSNQFNFRSSHKSRNGMMFFGGINGFNCFFPFNLSVNMVRPVTVISSVNIYGSGSSQESSNSRTIPDGGITLDHRTVTFDINFESLSFVAPGQNRYQWTMKGAYSDWITTDQHSVSFMKLPPGNYTFLVRGGNNDGYWSERPASLSIRILPHPLLGRAAISIYIAIALAILCLIGRIVMNIQKKRKQQELICAKMTFFTQVAHEIKTPVSLIKAPLEKIIANGRWDSDTESNLEIMKKNVDRLQKLIRQLLDFRKIDKNGYTLSLDRTDMSQMLTDIVERFRPSNTQIDVRLELPGEKVLCYIDSEAMTKVVSNLLTNAFKYARESISVSLETVSDRIVIIVKDDGQGIPSGMEERVFEPFYQADPYSGNGFGIGLSLVKLLVEKHGGKVSAGHEKEGGCKIIVDIPYISSLKVSPETEEPADPAAEVQASPEERLSTEAGPSLKSSILIVEDNQDMLQFLSENFAPVYKVYTATDGEAAMAVLGRYSCDLIISDIMMPGLDGFGLLKKVREDDLLKRIPIVLLSAHDTVDSKITGLEYGADAFIEKPFSIDHVKATVRSLIDNRRILFDHFAKYPNLFHETDGMDEQDRKWLEKVNGIIKLNIANDKFSVDVLAGEMAICRSNLQKKLKSLTGTSPNDYIRSVKLKLAAHLLKEGRYKINEVCYICGFNNASYFTKCFYRQFGMLPKDYAK